MPSAPAVNSHYTHIDAGTKRKAVAQLRNITKNVGANQLHFLHELERPGKRKKVPG